MSWLIFIFIAFMGASVIANTGTMDRDKPDMLRASILLVWIFCSFILRGTIARALDSLLFAVGSDPIFAPRRFLFSRADGVVSKHRTEREAFAAWKADPKNLVPIDDAKAEISGSTSAWFPRIFGRSGDFAVTRAWCRMAKIDFDTIQRK